MKAHVQNRQKLSQSRRRFLNASMAGLGLALTQCGWRQGSVQRTATPASATDDKLYIYTWAQYIDEDLIKGFAAKSGIQVVADVYDSNETLLAKLQAGGGNAYSVIYPSDYMVQRMARLGILRELELSQLNNLDNLASEFQNPSYDPGNRHSVPMVWGTTGFVYNSQKLTTAPIDWNYLWQHQKELSRRITLINDVREVMGATLRMLGYSYNSKDKLQIEQAYQKLKELKPSIAAFETDAWRNQILAGDLLVAMCYSTDGVPVSKENPNLKYVIPRSGSSLWTDTIAIPKSAPNPDAAYAWINYMLQPEVAAQLCQRLGVATPNQVALKQLPSDIRNNTNLFPPKSILAKCERIAPLGEVDAIYERYWTELTSS